jgi:hypothetical protein
VIVAVESAGESDFRAGGEEHLVVGAAFGGEEIAAVDHRRGQGAVVDERPRARPPGRTGVALEQLDGLVAEELHHVAPLDQGQALRGQALKFDRADLGTVLFPLALPLRLLVVVEVALDAADGAVKEVDRRPQQIFEVGFEACVGERGDKRIENVGDGAADGLGFGQRSRVGLVLERTVAVELQFG